MNLLPSHRARSLRPRRRPACAAMTLPEVMITSTIFGLAIGGFLVLQLFAMQMNATVAAKLNASDAARNALGRMISEIRMAGVVRIGTGDQDTFQEVAAGQAQRGNAIQIQASKGDTNEWVRYFWDADDTHLKRAVQDDPAVAFVAGSITNEFLFTSESFNGQVLSNNFNNRVIGVNLQFCQLKSRAASAAPGQQYDSYQLRTKITRRALE